MIKLLHLAAIWVLYAGTIYGQSKMSLSMEEAVHTALANRAEYQVNKLQEQIARKKTEVVQYGKIPTISGDYDLQRNLIIPTTPVPAIAFDPTASEGELTPLQFSTKWTSRAGVTASVDLYNPILKGKIDESELQEEISKTETRITENKLKYQVRSAYVAVLIAQEQWRLAVVDTLTKNQLLEMAISQHDSGRINDIQLNTVRNTLTQSKANFLNALKIYESSKVDLFAEMGLEPPRDVAIELTDSIPSWIQNPPMEEDNNTQDLNLKKIVQQQALNRLQSDNLRKTALPTITLSGFLGANYYENKFNIWKGENWYGNSYLKMGVHIPFTEGMDCNKRIEVLDLQRAVLEQNFSIREKEKKKELLKIQQDLKYTEKTFKLQEERILRSEKNYQLSVRQFDAGRILIKDLTEADYQYRLARSDYLQALYDHMKAQIDWTQWNDWPEY